MNANALESYLIWDEATEGVTKLQAAGIGAGALMTILSGLTIFFAKKKEKASRAQIKEFLQTHGHPDADEAMVDEVIREYKKYSKDPDNYSGPFDEIRKGANQ